MPVSSGIVGTESTWELCHSSFSQVVEMEPVTGWGNRVYTECFREAGKLSNWPFAFPSALACLHLRRQSIGLTEPLELVQWLRKTWYIHHSLETVRWTLSSSPQPTINNSQLVVLLSVLACIYEHQFLNKIILCSNQRFNQPTFQSQGDVHGFKMNSQKQQEMSISCLTTLTGEKNGVGRTEL